MLGITPAWLQCAGLIGGRACSIHRVPGVRVIPCSLWPLVHYCDTSNEEHAFVASYVSQCVTRLRCAKTDKSIEVLFKVETGHRCPDVPKCD